jgi:O-antigen/teichoic acid export membrane protein
MTVGVLRANSGRAYQYGWTIADQVVSSATNLVVAALAARALSPADFGEFGLLFAVFLIAVGLCRAWVTEPLAIRHAGDEEALAAAMPPSVRVAAGMGLCIGSALIATVWIVTGELRSSALALTVFLPALLVQEVLRLGLIVRQRAFSAFVNDAVWFAVAAAPLLMFRDSTTAASALAWWGLGALTAGLIGFRQHRISPVGGSTRHWLRLHRDLGWRYTIEFLAASTTGHFLVVIVGAILGLAAAGAVRGAQVLLGPLTVMFAALTAQAVPHLASLRDRPDRVMALSVRLSGAFVGIALAAGVVLLLLPDRLGTEVLGDTWAPAREILPAYVASWLAVGVAGGAMVGLRALGLASRSLVVQLLTAALTTGLVLLAAQAFEVSGVVTALAIGNGIGAFVWWLMWGTADTRQSVAGTTRSDLRS